VPSGFNQGNSLTLNLNRPDFTTAKRIVDKVNDLLGPGVAQAVDGSVRVSAPMDPSQRVDYLSILGKPRNRPGPGRGQSHHQLAYRHHRDRPERQGVAGG
jgi:flagellar P-ring protein precursor FlgI